MFEQATRLKLRFDTPKGQLSTEDLWDLPLTGRGGSANLDSLAIGLNTMLKETSVSFVNKENNPNITLQLKFDVVKHIIDVRLDEKNKADMAHLKSEQKQKLLAILSRKEEAALETLTPEEIRKMINDL